MLFPWAWGWLAATRRTLLWSGSCIASWTSGPEIPRGQFHRHPLWHVDFREARIGYGQSDIKACWGRAVAVATERGVGWWEPLGELSCEDVSLTLFWFLCITVYEFRFLLLPNLLTAGGKNLSLIYFFHRTLKLSLLQSVNQLLSNQRYSMLHIEQKNGFLFVYI